MQIEKLTLPGVYAMLRPPATFWHPYRGALTFLKVLKNKTLHYCAGAGGAHGAGRVVVVVKLAPMRRLMRMS